MTNWRTWVGFVGCLTPLACGSSSEDAPLTRSSVGAKGGTDVSGQGGGGGSGNAGQSGSSASSSGKGGAGGTSGASASGGKGGAGATGGQSGAGAGAGAGTGGSSAGRGGSVGTGGSGAGKGGGTGDAGAAGTAGTGGPNGGPSEGCISGSKPARGHYMIMVGSDQRAYYLVPSVTDEPVPLVLEFHGYNGTGEWIVPEFGLDTSLMGNAVIVAPDGSGQGDAIGWASGNDTPDIALVRAVIAQAEKDHCIDTSRIYALGASWGGWMATQVACALGPQIRAFVDASGGPPSGTCVGPVAGLVVHGMSDDKEPFSSGVAARDAFRKLNGCTDSLSDSDFVGCQIYAGCAQPLLWCPFDGGHITPQFLKDGLPAWFASLP